MNEMISVLNEGYVRIVDVMGDDTNVVNAARASFDKATEEMTEADVKLLKFLAREGHCYDEDTEVLTSEGFVSWPNVTTNHELAAVEPRSGKFSGFEKPQNIFKYKNHKELIKFKTHSVDLMVTEGHKLYCSVTDTVKKRSFPEYHLLYADMTLSGKPLWKKAMRMKTSAERQEEKKETELYWQGALTGFFLGDGHTAGGNQIKFHMKKSRKIAFIKELADKLGFQYKENANDNYVLSYPNLGKDFRELFYDGEKKKTFPDNFFTRGQEFWDGLEEGLKNSDGSIRSGGHDWLYSTTSKKLANKIQAMGALYGSTFSLNTNAKGVYTLKKYTRRKEPRLNDSPKNKAKKVAYNGNTYCATVSTGLMIVRRNGKVVLSGNSSPFRHAMMTFEIYAPLVVTRQWEKYIVGSDHTMDGRNEASRRYITEEPTFYVPTPEQWRKKPANSKQGSGGTFTPEELGIAYTSELEKFYQHAEAIYERALGIGIAPEQARLFLPAYGMYVRWRWTASLQSVAHFLNQRMAKDSQWEIQQYANAVYELVKPYYPHSIEALVNKEESE